MITYTLINNPSGIFQIVSNKLRTTVSPIPVGVYNYTVRATDDNGWTKDYNGSITVAIPLIVIDYNNITKTVRGTGPAGTATITLNGLAVSAVTINSSGEWSYVFDNYVSIGSKINLISGSNNSNDYVVSSIPLTIDRVMGFRSTSTAGLTAQENWLGSSVDYITVFAEQNNAANSWEDNLAFTKSEISKWAGTNKELRWSIPVCTGQTGENIDATIAGTHDNVIKSILQEMVNGSVAGKRIFLRPGWEPNLLTAYPWGASLVTTSKYIEAFRRVANIARSLSPLFVIEFIVSWRKDSGVDFTTMYPGDSYVDTIGLDAYCLTVDKGTGDVPNNDAGHASYMFTAPYGINKVRDFAVSHGKPMSVNEWGVNYDNPTFVSLMADFIRKNNITHHSYWDQNNTGFNCKLSGDQWPNSASEYLRQFGPFNILTQGLIAAPNSTLSGDIIATKTISKIEVISGSATVSGFKINAPSQANGTRRVTVRATDERGQSAERSIYLTWQVGVIATPEGKFGSSLVDARRYDDLTKITRFEGNIKSVTSRVGTSRDAVAPYTAARPTMTKRNGYQVASFSGSNGLVQKEVSNIPIAQAAITYCAMVYSNPAAGNFSYIRCHGSSDGVNRGIGVNNGNLRNGVAGGFPGDSISGLERSIVSSFGAGATAAVRSTVDGNSVKSGNVAIASNAYNRATWGCTANANDAIGSYWTGVIYEDFDLHGVLSASDEDWVHGYFAWSYGREASLPSTHPYRNNPPIV